jgi:hypothetical protein
MIKLDLCGDPETNQASVPNVYVERDGERLRIVYKEASELLDKKAIVEISSSGADGFVCSLFMIPKKSGGFRPMVNLKPLNKFIRYENFIM